MVEVAFFAGAIGALGGAIAVIGLRNPFYSVLALIVHLISLAGLFLLLYAEFLAAAQIVVYAGAVMVLYLFVAAYVGNVDEPMWEPIPGQRLLAPLLGLALFIELSIAILGTALKTFDSEGPVIGDSFGSPEAIGELLLEDFLIAFEAASLLLLLAAVGAVVLAGRRRDDPDEPTTRDQGDPTHSPNVGTSVNPTSPEGGPGPGPTDTHTSSQATGEEQGEPAAHEGGGGGGPAANQVAGPETSSETGGVPRRRTADGPPPSPPQGAGA